MKKKHLQDDINRALESEKLDDATRDLLEQCKSDLKKAKTKKDIIGVAIKVAEILVLLSSFLGSG